MKHSLLFTGHMLDAIDRTSPRFPAEKEKAAKEKIREYLSKENGEVKGLASGACGGDILFHELCLEMKIPTEMYLPLPIAEFKKTSVSFAGKNWSDRFDKLIDQLIVHHLPDAKSKSDKRNVWERTNLWMLKTALTNGGEQMTLIALWDKKAGDGNGGTEHMVNIARKRNAKVKIIDIKKI